MTGPETPERSDSELLAAWRGGDARAGAALFERHLRAIARFVRTKVSRESEAEDLIQATFLAALEAADRYRGEGSVRSFLLGIAYHKVQHYYQRQRRAPVDLDSTSVHDLAPTPSVALARRAEERLLVAALRRLPLRYQVVVELFYWEDLTGADIAELLGEPEGTVRTHLRRARLRLTEEIQRLTADPALRESALSGLDTWARGLRDSL